MTGFDIVILAVVAISALLAFARGFVREALSMAAMFIAILAVLWGFPLMRTPMRGLIETGWNNIHSCLHCGACRDRSHP